ncbi:MAG TPA: TonB family protein [Spirochaetia bacterium]|nr:TonB family protein [Spirochaetia bacterium]
MTGVQSFQNSELGDSRRLTVAILAALAIHLCLFAVFGIIRLAEHPVEAGPVSVDLLAGALGGLPASAPGPASAGPAVPGPVVQTGPASSAAVKPSRGGTAPGQDFVIPTPRQGTGAPTQPTGPSFRVAGSRTGAEASASQPATSPVQVPVFPRAQSNAAEGPAASAQGDLGGGSSRGVLVQGGGQQGVQGSLDLGSLDKSLAGARGQGGAAAAGGGGGGGGNGSGGSGSLGGGGGDYRFRWDQPDAARARRLLSTASPRIPPWVSKEGLTLTVLIAFTLTPDGILRDVNVEASSGYNDVDAAVSEAIRLWRFNADPGSRAIHGLIPYVIRAR